MKVKSKYLTLGLLFGFISCDLFIKDEIKGESLGLFDKESSILDTAKKSVKKTINKKYKGKVARNNGKGKDTRKDPSTRSAKRETSNNSNLLQKTVISEKERLRPEPLRKQSVPRKEKIQKQQDNHKGMTQGSLNSLRGENGELNKTIERNEIDFTIDSDLRPKNDLKAISGSNSISYINEIEEEDCDQYFFEKNDEYEEGFDEEIKLSNRYESYLEGTKYNVSSAISTIAKIYDNYTLFSTQQTQMYSTRLDSSTKAKAREEAKKFTKENLEKDLKTLLNYIQVSVKTAANFAYAREIHAKRKLNDIEVKIKNLILKIKEQSDSYEAYKAIASSILLTKDSLKEVQSAIDKNGIWH
ncbi:ferrous iron transporter A [Borreliella carolinensis]|uniref:ferrous iron transporter A n=1 Tax=Borreliella carolinensis TaxID=478174 RepID=UPI002943178A|nr:ferrous iron transporter A [Borreliella carolinensis]WNY65423.1 ferrous iron transporter A [Borreliella carolinensis]